MNDAIRSQLKDLQDQVTQVAREIDELRSNHPMGRRAWRRAQQQTSELGREAGRFASDHPAATGLAVLGVTAIAAACLLHGQRHD